MTPLARAHKSHTASANFRCRRSPTSFLKPPPRRFSIPSRPPQLRSRNPNRSSPTIYKLPPLSQFNLRFSVAMARLLSNMVFKGIAGAVRSKVPSLPALQHGMKYSIRITGDNDTHEDFRPTNKLDSSDLSVEDIVRQDVKENPVMIYMKGVPQAPQCGFSALAVKVLQQYGVSIGARNILEDAELKEGIKAFSNWPTFPQIFVKGEFIGGSDIILNMHKSGELKKLLEDDKGDDSTA